MRDEREALARTVAAAPVPVGTAENNDSGDSVGCGGGRSSGCKRQREDGLARGNGAPKEVTMERGRGGTSERATTSEEEAWP